MSVKSLLVETTKSGVRTIRLNNPVKLNAWSQRMMREMFTAMDNANQDSQVHAVVLTGTGGYYCAGVDLAAVLKPGHPKKLVATIKDLNQRLFDQFIDFQKPIFVACNGPAIGASVTSATLCDGLIANDRATFHTPFASLGLVPEGCSSYLFPKILGDELANKMLFENLKIDSETALKHGLVHKRVVTEPSEQEDAKLLDEAHDFVQNYLGTHGTKRSRTQEEAAHLKQVNEKESIALSEAFVSNDFFLAMEKNAERKGKANVKRQFQLLRLTRPIWSMLL